MPPRPVAVTGVGPVSAAGLGREAFWASLVAPDDGPTPALIEGFDCSPWLGRADARRTDPYLQYAVAAAGLALDDAGSPAFDPDRSGVVMANLYGAARSLEVERDVLAADGPKLVAPLLAPHACEDACASQLSIRFGLRGPSLLAGASCAGGTVALGVAAGLIASGTCDLVLAGGSFGPMTDVLRASYDRLRVLSPTGRARPFDARRDGFVVADGACVLVLESAEHAHGRGADVLGWVRGWAQTNDAHHVSRPSGDGIERCLTVALDHAGVAAGDIAHVNAHATGTATGDRVEAEAIGRAVGRPAVTSIKARTGHTMPAAGAFEAASVLLAFRHRLLPPTATELEVDADIDADVVWGAPRPWEPAPALSSSFGLGGQNACLVLAPTPGPA